MTCETCGEKPKKDRHFPNAVVEINNPESLVLLRKVVISASLGDDTTVPPVIGKYRNVILQYEANNHLYLYSSDGIPTAIESNVPQEVLDRITTLETDVTALERELETETGARERADGVLQQEIDDLKNSPDVVDIVATYADLMAYDTSSLGDKDVIRVLADETHEGQSDYYRWSTTTETWTFIGAVGNYYTKDQIDSLLDEKQDELTPGENISIVDESGALVISAQDTTYTAGTGLDLAGTEFSVDSTTIPTKTEMEEALADKQDLLTAGDNITIEDESGSLVISATDTTYTFDNTPTAGSANPVTSEGIKSYVDTSPAFKPFPVSVDTTHTTQAFMSSILALSPEIGTAYLGTVSLSDMPAGLMQEEVEVYVYSDYVVYCIMRSTDVSPYAWWCSSYNYQGWRPVNTDTTYSAGSGLNLNGTTFSVDTTTIQPKLTAGSNISISGDTISATDTTYSAFTGATAQDAGSAGLVPAPAAGDDTKFLSGNGLWTTVSQYNLPIASANDLGGIKVGTNLSIDSNTGVLSATDTTYSAGNGLDLTGTTFSVDNSTIPTKTEMQAALDEKQDELTAGTGISITDESGALVISATGAQIATINAQDWSALWQ